MKITYEFDPYLDAEALQIYSQADKMHSALWEFSNGVLRDLSKHGYLDGRELSEIELELVSYIKDRFYDILANKEVEL